MSLSKDYIQSSVSNGQLKTLVQHYGAMTGDLLFILETIAADTNQININDLLHLLHHENEKVRILIVKLIGREQNLNFFKLLIKVAKEDISSMVRREAVSSIGRLRNEVTIPTLFSFLEDNDPKIVSQAIRGLLLFKNNQFVAQKLKGLITHENEIVRSTIHREFYSQPTKSKDVLRHIDTFDYLRNVVVNDDVREVLKYVPSGSVHLTFTSPPYYNARDYSIYKSYEAYLLFLKEVFAEIFRITKEGRFLIVNTSPIIVPRISRAHSSKRYPIPFDIHHDLVQIGWEFIDDIIWMKPEYSVKNRVAGFHQHRKPLGYKPNPITEYLMVYRKPTDKLLDWNMHQYPYDVVKESLVPDDYETSNVWQINPKSDKIHSAVFPEELCKRVIQYYSYVNDLVFDPFGGSGTCGRVARILKRFSFMTELDPKYFEYIKQLDYGMNNSLFNRPVKYLSLEQFKNSIK